MSHAAPSDVAIIGGGIVGAAAAAFLASAGIPVTLYEIGEAVASAASGRNAGSIVHPPDPVLGTLCIESLGRYRELEGEPIGLDDRFHVPVEPGGVLAVAFDGDLVRRVARAIGAAQPTLSPEILDGAALAATEPAVARGLTAFRLATGYSLRPADATRAYAALAARHGATIRTGTGAQPWLEDGVARGVRVDNVRIPADWVLVAAGPWTPGLVDEGGSWRPIAPLWGVIVDVDLDVPPTHVIEELVDENSLALSGPSAAGPAGTALDPSGPGPRALPQPVVMVNPGVSSTGGRRAPTAVGGTLAPLEPEAGRVAPTLVEHALPFLPGLGAGRMGAIRACARPQSIDGRPLIGRVPGIDRLIVAAGNGGWGISTGPATARLAADAIVLETDGGIPPELRADRFAGPVDPTGDRARRSG